ncbi:hypothetical protein D3C72_1897120 [compost metagenome]
MTTALPVTLRRSKAAGVARTWNTPPEPSDTEPPMTAVPVLPVPICSRLPAPLKSTLPAVVDVGWSVRVLP